VVWSQTLHHPLGSRICKLKTLHLLTGEEATTHVPPLLRTVLAHTMRSLAATNADVVRRPQTSAVAIQSGIPKIQIIEGDAVVVRDGPASIATDHVVEGSAAGNNTILRGCRCGDTSRGGSGFRR
jgi:hypothetical protein